MTRIRTPCLTQAYKKEREAIDYWTRKLTDALVELPASEKFCRRLVAEIVEELPNKVAERRAAKGGNQ